jgi:Transposase, Mutator family
VSRTVPPSAEIEEQIDRLLAVGVGENPRESLSELARLGARLIIQRAVEDEFDAWLGRARYERRPDHRRGLRSYDSGLRDGFRPRRVQTLEGELKVEIPQVREAAWAVRLEAVPVQRQGVAQRAAAGDGDRRVRRGAVDARHRVAVREGGARQAVEDDRLTHLRGAQGALRGLQASRPLRGPAGGAVPRRGLPLGAPARAQGGRAGGLGLHRAGRAGAAVGDARDARVARGLAGTRARPDRPWARRAAADRGRRRRRA